ncbi:TIGR03086 family metal-binding protein [Embleya sp. MST-111070]|uniref:TIGR03086 family metal-binding protein n=1 Tax=Embleya sp. MST-111070 TaxID=3398231 RepID=UPI003F733EF4
MSDIRLFDLRALRIAEEVVGQVTVDRLAAPTPCAGWDLARLLAHMTGQNHGFAAAARGIRTDAAAWADRPVEAEPGKVFAASVADVAAAFAEDGAVEREWWLPEVRRGQSFPGRVAMGFHFVDYVVHAWDVAVSIGVTVEFDADLLAAVLPIAEAVPGGAARTGPDAAFRPAIEDPDPSRVGLDRVLRLLGRSPDWPRG